MSNTLPATSAYAEANVSGSFDEPTMPAAILARHNHRPAGHEETR